MPVGVGTQIADVGLLIADKAGAVLSVAGEVDGTLGHDLVEDGLKLGEKVLEIGVHVGVGLGVVADELAGDGAVGRDRQLAEVGKLGAGGGEDNGIARGVLDLLGSDDAVAVAVDEGVKALYLGNDIGGTVGRALGIYAEVTDGNDIVGAGFNSGVDGSLYGLDEFVLAEAVNVFAVGVLEIDGGGLGVGLGGADADVGDLGVAVFDHLVGVKDGLSGTQVDKVAADVAAVELVGHLKEALHAEVELVVAHRDDIVAGLVHGVDYGLSISQRAIGSALNGSPASTSVT